MAKKAKLPKGVKPKYPWDKWADGELRSADPVELRRSRSQIYSAIYHYGRRNQCPPEFFPSDDGLLWFQFPVS